MHALEQEGDHATLAGGLADDRQTGDVTQCRGRALQQVLLVRVDHSTPRPVGP